MGYKFLYGHTHRVIAAADYIRDSFLRTLKLPPRQVVTVHQGESLDGFDATPPPATVTLGIVARLDPVKGHRYLLEALSLLKYAYPDLRLKIIGQEENVKQRDLKYMTERLRIDHQVDFLGFQSDIPKAMAGCTIGVIASTGSEAVSRVALEWMAARRPVVATRVGCLPEIVTDKATGLLVDPKDAPALARVLGFLLHNPKVALSMGQAGRRRVEEHV